VQQLDRFISASEGGQLALREVVRSYLGRVEHDFRGIAARLYPFTRAATNDAPRLVVIDPLVAFGRPVLADTGVPIRAIADRFKAGDSVEDLARDYEISPVLVQEAIRCELPEAA
jgi:uncharacterized protein (DUF433 family)